MTKLDKAKEVTYLQRVYPEIIKPPLESRRAQLDPSKKPVEFVLLDAFLERMEVFYRAGADGADEQLAREIEELAPWVNPSLTISADKAHSGPLGEMMHDAGCEHPEIYATLEQTRKRNDGRPLELIAIEVLEMYLVEKKSQAQIADALKERLLKKKPYPETNYALDDTARGEILEERIRKYIAKLKPIYEKYKKGN